MTVKVTGDVAAVEAAVQTGRRLQRYEPVCSSQSNSSTCRRALVESFNDDFTDKPAKVADETEKPQLDEKRLLRVLDEIVSKIIGTEKVLNQQVQRK